MEPIFDFQSQFLYLKERLSAENSSRGMKTQLAEALLIQPAFLSQVLSGKYSLSLEQADLANKFFDHATDESNFFLLLVSRDRASTSSLKKHFDHQLNLILKKRQRLIERLGRKAEMSAEVEGIYYSSWMYGAIHIACTIPEMGSRKLISEKLNLSIEVVGNVLDFLTENNFLQKSAEKYKPTDSWARLDKKSPHIIRHHANWRQKAIQNLENQTDDDLHYSGVFSMDQKTARKIQNAVLDFVKLQLKDIEAAKEEDLFVFGIDFFNLMKK